MPHPEPSRCPRGRWRCSSIPRRSRPRSSRRRASSSPRRARPSRSSGKVIAAGGGAAEGTVKVTDDGKVIATATLAAAAKGKFDIALPQLSRGTHLLRVSFTGADGWADSRFDHPAAGAHLLTARRPPEERPVRLARVVRGVLRERAPSAHDDDVRGRGWETPRRRRSSSRRSGGCRAAACRPGCATVKPVPSSVPVKVLPATVIFTVPVGSVLPVV